MASRGYYYYPEGVPRPDDDDTDDAGDAARISESVGDERFYMLIIHRCAHKQKRTAIWDERSAPHEIESEEEKNLQDWTTVKHEAMSKLVGDESLYIHRERGMKASNTSKISDRSQEIVCAEEQQDSLRKLHTESRSKASGRLAKKTKNQKTKTPGSGRRRNESKTGDRSTLAQNNTCTRGTPY